MRTFKLLAALALIAPALALAQVGPNPAANGSLDPTVGRGGDAATAPDDIGIGANATDGARTPLPDPADAADTDSRASGNAATAAPMSPKAARTKSSTAPTSESARKPR